MKKLVLLFTILFCWGCSPSTDNTGDLSIIPYPNEIEVKSNQFLTLGNEVSISMDTPFPASKKILQYFSDRLKEHHFKLVQKNSGKIDFRFIVDSSFPDEAYGLTIGTEGIILSANEEGAGFFYGIQSLLQMFPTKNSGNVLLPCLRIKDVPRFPYRGAMIDVARNFQSKETVLKFIDLMSVYKMNHLHLHLTDDQGWRIEIKKYPKLTDIGSTRTRTMVGHSDYYFPRRFDSIPQKGFYTQEDIKEIVRYAQERFITIIPEIEMPGHSSAALAAYPQYSCGLGKNYVVRDYMDIFDEVYCPHEGTIQFLQDILSEIMELFPSQYIHIGGDECPKKAWKACSKCQALIKKERLKDEHELQSWFIHRIEKFVNSKGRNIIGWDEILEGGLAPNATVMSWRGEKGGITAAQMKHNVIMTPGDYCYIDHYQEDPEFAPLAIGSFLPLDSVYAYNPLPDILNEEQQKYIIGTQANLWGEYVQTSNYLEYMAFPRLLAMAEVQWTETKNKNIGDFLIRLKKNFAWLDNKGINACRNFYEVSFHGIWNKAKSSQEITLKTLCPGGEIRYAINDSTESQFQTYTSPLLLNKETEIFAAVYLNNKRMGNITHKRFTVNKATGCDYTCTPKAGWGHIHNGYGLTDGLRGYTKDMRQWICFHEDTLQIDITLHPKDTIRQVKLASLWRPWNKIWPARQVQVCVSQDGLTYYTVAQSQPTYDFTRTEATRFPVSLNFKETTAKFLRLMILGGGNCPKGYYKEGTPSELALDEIEIY